MPVVGATTVQQLKARLAQITGQSPAAIQVLLNGRIVADTTTMEQVCCGLDCSVFQLILT